MPSTVNTKYGVEEKEKKIMEIHGVKEKAAEGVTTETSIFFLQVTTRFDKQLFFKKRTFGFFHLITHTMGERQGRTTLNNWTTSWMPRRKDCEK